MEEEKAAAYYDELVRKGGNAAKYKQGLGFGSSQGSVPKNDGYGSLSNFIKSSPGRTAALEKESRLDNIRDKLKRKDDEYSLRKRSSDKDFKKDREEVDDRGHGRRNWTPESPRDDRKREKSSRHRGLSSEDRDSEIVKKAEPNDRKRRSRSTSRTRESKSPKYKARSETPEKDSKSKRRRKLEQRRSRSRSPDSSGMSSERGMKRSRRLKEDLKSSPGDDSRSKYRKSPGTSRRTSRRSRSRSVDRRRRDRSGSRGRDSDRRRSRKRSSSYSPQRSRRREPSRSPTSHRSSYRSRDYRSGGRFSERQSSYRTGSSRRRDEDERRKEELCRDQDRRPRDKSQSAQEKIQERDYSKLIPNFESMTPAEKVKAKMKLQLSETVLQDKAKGMSDEWERFDFNKDAPLDDDAKQDYFGDGTGARDDTEFLKNTGCTFLSSTNQVTREGQVQSVHDHAIFGPPQGLRIIVTKPEIPEVVEKKDSDVDVEDQPIIVEETNISRKKGSPQKSSLESEHLAGTVVSHQVLAMQQAGSWQERARKMREARAAVLES